MRRMAWLITGATTPTVGIGWFNPAVNRGICVTFLVPA
jgi:hypothetical protein